MITPSSLHSYTSLDVDVLKKAYFLTCACRELARMFHDHANTASHLVYSTSYGHEAIQLAVGLQVKSYDYLYPYYRDDALLLSIGITPYELALQWMAKSGIPSAMRRYAHAVLRKDGFPTLPFGGFASGTHIVPATGAAHGLAYLASQQLLEGRERSIVICSLGDGAITRSEVAEAFQMAILKKLPIVYIVQDNDWAGSAKSEEVRAVDAYEYAGGFRGLRRMRVNGADFVQAYENVQLAMEYVRNERSPILLHAKCPLLGDHSSQIRREQYRDEENWQMHQQDDPLIRLRKYLIVEGGSDASIEQIEHEARTIIAQEFQKALDAEMADAALITDQDIYAPATQTEEIGNRAPDGVAERSFVEIASNAVKEIMHQHPEALYCGLDVASPLGGIYGEATSLTEQFDSSRVFNMPPLEAYLIGAVAGMSAIGCNPIVEIQSANQVWGGISQLTSVLAKSYLLSDRQFPAGGLIRVLTGATDGNEQYSSASMVSALLAISGIKIVYPSNAADAKGLLKASFTDPNPVIFLENIALYSMPEAAAPEPDAQYSIPLGKAHIVQAASEEKMDEGYSLTVITYGMGVLWTRKASEQYQGSVEILDLRTLQPLDWQAIEDAVKRHNKVLIVTEEGGTHSFAESLAGRISKAFFQSLDAPVHTYGALSNSAIENHQISNEEKVAALIGQLLNY